MKFAIVAKAVNYSSLTTTTKTRSEALTTTTIRAAL